EEEYPNEYAPTRTARFYGHQARRPGRFLARNRRRIRPRKGRRIQLDPSSAAARQWRRHVQDRFASAQRGRPTAGRKRPRHQIRLSTPVSAFIFPSVCLHASFARIAVLITTGPLLRARRDRTAAVCWNTRGGCAVGVFTPVAAASNTFLAPTDQSRAIATSGRLCVCGPADIAVS